MERMDVALLVLIGREKRYTFQKMTRRTRWFLVLSWLAGAALTAQTPPSSTPAQTPGTIQYPAAMPLWSTKMALGVSVIAMPAAIVQEGASIHWPLIGFDFTLGLPDRFTLASTFSTEIATNHIELSPRWTHDFSGRLHGDVGLGGAYWFGELHRFGFDNSIHGWFVYPSAGIGYDFGSLAVTAQAKASVITSLTSYSGSLVSIRSTNSFNGMSYRLVLEQPFWKHTTVGLSLQASYLKFYYPQWPLFPTFDRRFWIPEAGIRFTL